MLSLGPQTLVKVFSVINTNPVPLTTKMWMQNRQLHSKLEARFGVKLLHGQEVGSIGPGGDLEGGEDGALVPGSLVDTREPPGQPWTVCIGDCIPRLCSQT